MTEPRPTSRRLSDAARRPLAGPLGIVRAVERRGRRAAADAAIAAADAWLSSPELERIVGAVVDHEGTQRIADRILDSLLARTVGGRIVDSGALDAVFDRLAGRPSFWAMVDVVAGSPSVTDAIASQSRSAVTDVVDDVRDGAAQADDWLERVAHRLAGRRSAP